MRSRNSRFRLFGWAFVLAAASAPATAQKDGWVSLPPVRYHVLKSAPAGGAMPSRKDIITVNYELKLDDGKLVESTFAKNEPATFPLNRLIGAWQAVLPLMHVGDEWEIVAPPQFAYGAKGTEGIPPGATLHFRVQLLAVAPPPPAQ
jgi:peptidylprolyl isomerase/FKBP-type peptidyl-prolyl cis-trans isomerase FklB